jgi:NADPH-dependent glutamate synthase beta subunit-like oxidoreductase
MGEKIIFKSYREMPMNAMTVDDMMWNLTGSWRNVRPYYDFKISPCSVGCPAGEDIQRYIYLVMEQRYEEAWRTIIETNPMPAVTGRVCYHPCMEKCTRKDFDQAINIPGIERALGDMGLENTGWMNRIDPSFDKKAAVVGGGPAGLACACFLARSGIPVTIFEADRTLGGVLRWGIPEYRLPNEILDQVVRQILDSGPITVEANRAVGRDVDPEKIMAEFDAVFVGVGLMRSRALGLDGEDGGGVEPGLEFLRRVNSGERTDPGKRVVVVGGGNTAMDVARCARRAGSDVTIVYRRTMNEMPAIADEIEEAEREGVQFRYLAAPKELRRDGDRLTAVVFQEMELGEPDESGRRRPVPVEGKTFTLEVDTLFTAIGEQADLGPFEKIVDCEWNLIKTSDAFGQTSHAKIFAGGDVVTGAASVVEAIAAGREAAGRITRIFSGAEEPAAEAERTVVGIEDINTVYFDRTKRTLLPRIPAAEAVTGFKEIHAGFDSTLLHREAERCFSCGVCNYCDNCWVFCPDVAIKRLENEYEIDYDYCKGCLVCVIECPRSCISTREEGK